MSSNHEATLSVQNYREYVNKISINDTINKQKQLFLSYYNTFRLYCILKYFDALTTKIIANIGANLIFMVETMKNP